MKRNILLNPGPATTTPSVKQAQIVPDICPREKEFQDLMTSIRKDLVKIAGGDKNYTAILFAGSGTAAMEATMCSVVPEDNYALVLVNGVYGLRFCSMASANNIPDIRLEYPFDRTVGIDSIKDMLEKGINIGATFVTHHETTTGILNPINEIGTIVKEHNIPYVIDTISSFAGVPLSIKKCKADFIMSTANKCLQGMPGISFVIAKKDALEKCIFNFRSVYLDLYKQYKYLEKHGQMQFTPPVQSMYALRQAIDELFEEGIENRQERYKKNHQLLINGMKARGFKLFLTQQVEHSNILETFYEPKNFNFERFHDKLYKRGFTIYPGKLQKENTFRLSILGDLYEDDIKRFLDAVDEVL